MSDNEKNFYTMNNVQLLCILLWIPSFVAYVLTGSGTWSTVSWFFCLTGLVMLVMKYTLYPPESWDDEELDS